jgi:lipoprotein NlpI
MIRDLPEQRLQQPEAVTAEYRVAIVVWANPVGEWVMGCGRGALMGAAIILAEAFSSLPTAAQSVPEWKCTHGGVVALDERIASCAAVIDLGKYGSKGAVSAYLNRAKAYVEKSEFDRAIADYNEVIKLFPKNMYAYYGRGFAYYKQGEFDHAIADFTEVIELNPRDERAYLSRATAYLHIDDFDRAIADYTQTILLSPKDEHVYCSLGAAYRAAGDFDRAIAEFTRAIEINPQYHEAYVLRANAYKAKDDFGRANADYDQAIALNPRDAHGYRLRGLMRFETGALAKSLDDLNQSSAVDPKDPYTALWIDILGKRQNLPSRLAEATPQLDMTKWPAPIIRLFLGEMTSEAMLAAADDPDAKKKKGQVCEANFYAGELALQQGAKEDAGRLFRLAAADCSHAFLEWSAANSELKGLSANP